MATATGGPGDIGPDVKLGSGRTVPGWLEFAAWYVEPGDTGVEPGYEAGGRLVLDERGEHFELERFEVRRRSPSLPPITAAVVRDFPPGEVAKAVLRQVVQGHLARPDEMTALTGAEVRALGLRDRRALGVVADTYRAALLDGWPPAEAVAERLECSPASAGRWIAAARVAGLLTPRPQED